MAMAVAAVSGAGHLRGWVLCALEHGHVLVATHQWVPCLQWLPIWVRIHFKCLLRVSGTIIGPHVQHIVSGPWPRSGWRRKVKMVRRMSGADVWVRVLWVGQCKAVTGVVSRPIRVRTCGRVAVGVGVVRGGIGCGCAGASNCSPVRRDRILLTQQSVVTIARSAITWRTIITSPRSPIPITLVVRSPELLPTAGWTLNVGAMMHYGHCFILPAAVHAASVTLIPPSTAPKLHSGVLRVGEGTAAFNTVSQRILSTFWSVWNSVREPAIGRGWLVRGWGLSWGLSPGSGRGRAWLKQRGSLWTNKGN